MIVGAGVMGSGVAWELAKRGIAVTVLERSVPGAEASSHAAGILGATIEAHAPGPLLDFGVASRALWPRWARELRRATGIDVALRERGVLRLAFEAEDEAALRRELVWKRRAGLDVRRITTRELATLEPALARPRAALLCAGDAQLDPVLLARALHVAAERAGARFVTGHVVRRIVVESGRARGVELDDGTRLAADHVVLAAGSWSALVEGSGLRNGDVAPARGQIVELRSSLPPLGRVVFGPRCYLVPREDGRVLVGSTLEFVGFDREPTAAAVRDLLSAAIELCPALGAARPGASWASFRPWTPDERPLVGASRSDGLLLATGHYRNGLLLAPLTATSVAALVLGRRPPHSLNAFSN